jgi:hypothetical protein
MPYRLLALRQRRRQWNGVLAARDQGAGVAQELGHQRPWRCASGGRNGTVF